MITKKQICPLGLLLCWIGIIGFGGFIQPKVALAASQDISGYQITPVTLSTSTIAYGDSSETFRAQLTVPPNAPAPDSTNFYIKIDNQPYQANGSVSGTAPTYSLSASGIGAGTPLAIGTHTVIAEYAGAVTISSQPATLTVTRATPSLSCTNGQSNTIRPPGVPLTIGMQLSTNSNVQVDWQNATYTITFIGAQHTITETNLQPDPSDQVYTSTPVEPDNYTVKCTFNGTSLFNPAVATLSQHIQINGQNQIGGIQLYTNPTTIQAGQPTTWRVVVTGASGLPTPTGSIQIVIGGTYLPEEHLDAGGTATFQANAPTPLNGNTITVWYLGDPVYVGRSANFPFTNPPIPGGGQPTPTPVPSSGAAATSTPGASATPINGATAIATSTGTATGTPAASVTPTTATSVGRATKNNAGNNIGWLWLGILVVLASSGTVVLIALLRRRRVVAATITGPAITPNEDTTIVEVEHAAVAATDQDS